MKGALSRQFLRPTLPLVDAKPTLLSEPALQFLDRTHRFYWRGCILREIYYYGQESILDRVE